MPPRETAEPSPPIPVKKKKKRKSARSGSSDGTSVWQVIGGLRVIWLVVFCVTGLFGAGARNGFSGFGFGAGTETPRAREAVALFQQMTSLVDRMAGTIEGIPASGQPSPSDAMAIQSCELEFQNLHARLQGYRNLDRGEDQYVRNQTSWAMREAFTRMKYAMKRFESRPGMSAWASEMDKALEKMGGPTR